MIRRPPRSTPLSLHDALPIYRRVEVGSRYWSQNRNEHYQDGAGRKDRKSTRLNSSHSQISYAVFCLKKKNSSARHGNSTVAYNDAFVLLTNLIFASDA